MKFSAFSIVLLVAVSHLTYAQTSVFEVKPGQSIREVIPDSVIYFSPGFVKGTAKLKSGKSGLMTLNFNRFFDEMLFIDEKGDTLAVSNPDDFVYMKIKETTFYPEKGKYYQEVSGYGDLKLAERSYFAQSNQKKGGAMGGKNSTASVDVINVNQAEVGLLNLVANEYQDLKFKREYYIGDKNNRFKPLNKKNLLSASKNKDRVKEYLSNNKVNFNDPAQISAMLKYTEGDSGV